MNFNKTKRREKEKSSLKETTTTRISQIILSRECGHFWQLFHFWQSFFFPNRETRAVVAASTFHGPIKPLLSRYSPPTPPLRISHSVDISSILTCVGCSVDSLFSLIPCWMQRLFLFRLRPSAGWRMRLLPIICDPEFLPFAIIYCYGWYTYTLRVLSLFFPFISRVY